MAYQVIARKWRPKRFADMVGQEHIARTLKNAIKSGRIAQAYLFVGPRGIGKTTSARIFAKALNCSNPQDGEPCCECESCKAIDMERSVDVIEFDAATHTQVDSARQICEEALHLPISSKYKIFIIDEVHMLSKSAWNALLKTIEEPPEHAKFIFATTEVNKVLTTVISRCQRFDLKRIPANLIAERLELIAKTENVAISRSALDVIARAADGGMRDAQSLLDQMISFFATGSNEGKEITEEQALSIFGLTASAQMKELIAALVCNSPKTAVLNVHNLATEGKNLETLFDEILVWLRGLLMCSIMPDPLKVLDENEERIAEYKELAKITQPGIIQRLLEQFSSTGYLLREAINKQVFIETLLLKGMRLAHAPIASDIIARLNYIRKNGELAPLDAAPAYINLPSKLVISHSEPYQAATVQPTTAQPQPIKPQSAEKEITAEKIPAEIKTADKILPAQVEEEITAEKVPAEIKTADKISPARIEEEITAETVYKEFTVPVQQEQQSFISVKNKIDAPVNSKNKPANDAPENFSEAAEFSETSRKTIQEKIAEIEQNPAVSKITAAFSGKVSDIREFNEIGI